MELLTHILGNTTEKKIRCSQPLNLFFPGFSVQIKIKTLLYINHGVRVGVACVHTPETDAAVVSHLGFDLRGTSEKRGWGWEWNTPSQSHMKVREVLCKMNHYHATRSSCSPEPPN